MAVNNKVIHPQTKNTGYHPGWMEGSFLASIHPGALCIKIKPLGNKFLTQCCTRWSLRREDNELQSAVAATLVPGVHCSTNQTTLCFTCTPKGDTEIFEIRMGNWSNGRDLPSSLKFMESVIFLTALLDKSSFFHHEIFIMSETEPGSFSLQSTARLT